MIKSKILIIIILIIYSLLLISSDFISSNGVSSQAVQAVINTSKTGDIVIIPRGHSEWTSSVSIPDNKKITLVGAGSRRTIIKSNMPNPIIYVNRSGSRVTNIGFELQNADGRGIAVRGIGWRVDHCRFIFTGNSISGRAAVYAYGQDESDGHPVGVIDHNEFYDTRVWIIGSLHLLAHTIWHEPLELGTNNAVFVEDNVFTRTRGNVVDSHYGGRYVFRYNTVNDAYIESHAVHGNFRAARSWEIYNNTINQVGISMWVPMFLRGGTGVVFNNTITGNWNDEGFALDYRRANESFPGCGIADGTNPWDGNDDPPNYRGWPGRDQIGRSTDQWLWTDTNPYPPQESYPAYCWNNIYNGKTVGFFVHNNCEDFLVEGRDFYNNQKKPGYTPYTYPHPLVKEDKLKPKKIRVDYD